MCVAMGSSEPRDGGETLCVRETPTEARLRTKTRSWFCHDNQHDGTRVAKLLSLINAIDLKTSRS
jgi:hypothetical protein